MTRNKLKLWIFQLVVSDYAQRGFDQVARFCTSLSVETHTLGWQKIDFTETVQRWYEQSPGEKLRLLIDCTGCGHHFVLHMFDRHNQTQSTWSKEMPRQRRRTSSHRKKNDTMQAGTPLTIFEVPVERQRTKDGGMLNMFRKSIGNRKYEKAAQLQVDQQQRNLNNYKYIPTYRENNIQSVKHATPKIDEATITELYHLEDRLNPNRPFLVLHTEPQRARRVRRRVIDCDGALHAQCCKESFYVSFKALGWDDWIIAPRGYFANYCRGDCSGPYRTPDTFQTFHSHFIEEYRKMGLLNGMQPCCAPLKFSSMSLIYYGDDGIIKRDLPKMVVDECGCP